MNFFVSAKFSLVYIFMRKKLIITHNYNLMTRRITFHPEFGFFKKTAGWIVGLLQPLGLDDAYYGSTFGGLTPGHRRGSISPT